MYSRLLGEEERRGSQVPLATALQNVSWHMHPRFGGSSRRVSLQCAIEFCIYLTSSPQPNFSGVTREWSNVKSRVGRRLARVYVPSSSFPLPLLIRIAVQYTWVKR